MEGGKGVEREVRLSRECFEGCEGNEGGPDAWEGEWKGSPDLFGRESRPSFHTPQPKQTLFEHPESKRPMLWNVRLLLFPTPLI